jgi:transcriptional regulator with XRE-family HTH domain
MAQKAKDWRLVRACTQVELADKIEMSNDQICRYEQGDASFKKLPQMAEGLSVLHGVLLPTSKEESYCEDESSEGENKILSIMREYQKIDNQKLKDLLCSFLSEVVKISEEELRQ